MIIQGLVQSIVSLTTSLSCQLIKYTQLHDQIPASTSMVPVAQVVEHPVQELKVVGLNPGLAIHKALKMVPAATLLGAHHYKAILDSLL